MGTTSSLLLEPPFNGEGDLSLCSLFDPVEGVIDLAGLVLTLTGDDLSALANVASVCSLIISAAVIPLIGFSSSSSPQPPLVNLASPLVRRAFTKAEDVAALVLVSASKADEKGFLGDEEDEGGEELETLLTGEETFKVTEFIGFLLESEVVVVGVVVVVVVAAVVVVAMGLLTGVFGVVG